MAAGGGAAGGSVTLSETFTSGSRLKSVAITDEAGNTAHGGWHDVMLDDRCTFMHAGDGQLRCVPFYGPYAPEGLFSDAACTQPAFLTHAQCLGTPKHAIRYDTTVCPLRAHVFKVGAATGATTIYSRSGTSCFSQPVQPGQRVFSLGTEIAPGALVAGTVMQGSGAFDLNGLVAADGARGTQNYRDGSLGTDCYPQRFSDGAVRCAPTPFTFGGTTFASSTCTTPSFLHSGPCPAPQLTATLATTSPSCALDFEYGRLGSQLTAYYSGSPGMCEAQQTSPQLSAYAAGAAIAASSLPTATTSSASAGRLERVVLTWPGGKTTHFEWRDAQLDVACQTYFAAADGSRRCVPFQPGIGISGYFADLGCTQPLASVQRAGTGCTPRFATEYFDHCGRRARVFRVGARHTGAVYGKTTTGCAAQTGVTTALYAITSEMAPSELAPLTESVR